MEKRINELEFDEFEKLLGEIPSATSGNLSSDQSGVTNFSKDLKVSSLYGSLSLERQRVVNNGALNEGKVSPSNVQQSNIKGVQLEEPNLPDDQSLTSAFTELSFTDRGVTGPANPPFVNGTSFLLNGQCPNSLKNLTSRMDFSGAVPLAHGVQGFHLLQNVPIPGVEFPVIPNQQQFYMDAPAGLPYLHPQQLSQPQITWRHVVEEEQYYRMHQQYMYLQQLRNQQVDSQHPIQNNGNLVRIMNRGAENLYNQKQVSFQREQFNQQPFRNKTTIPRSTNRIVDQTDKQNFPEKILTRANGLNSLRSIKFGSFGGNEPLVDVKYGNCNLSTPNVGLRMDNLSSRGSSLGIFDLKHNTPLQKCNSLEEFTGRIYLMAKDQHGCRFLQRKFTEGTPEDVEKIFLEIIVHIVELMTDPFGNYLVQKLLEVCDEDQQMQILHSITRKTGDLVRISCDMHGTRAVQKVIETLKTPKQFSLIVSALKPGIVTMVKNMNGNHVAQRCLQYLTSEYSEFLFEAATANCVELATDRHGCCVLQKCLSHSDNEQRRALVHEITSNALILSQDPFGNYVVQFVLEIHVPWATAEILDQLEGNYVDMSVQKYSSNVVEKCLKYTREERRLSIIQELVNNPRLDQIMQDPYGNYVIQAALNLSKGALHAALMEAIRAHVPVLRSSPYGKKILSSNGLKK